MKTLTVWLCDTYAINNFIVQCLIHAHESSRIYGWKKKEDLMFRYCSNPR